jgi:hypothetical protein
MLSQMTGVLSLRLNDIPLYIHTHIYYVPIIPILHIVHIQYIIIIYMNVYSMHTMLAVSFCCLL